MSMPHDGLSLPGKESYNVPLLELTTLSFWLSFSVFVLHDADRVRFTLSRPQGKARDTFLNGAALFIQQVLVP
jgi:hypothetical protein